MKTEKHEEIIYNLYTQKNFEDLSPNEQQLVLKHISKEEFQGSRQLHLSLTKNMEHEELKFDSSKVLKSIIAKTDSTKKYSLKQILNTSISLYKVAVMLVISLTFGVIAGKLSQQPHLNSQNQAALLLALEDSIQHNKNADTNCISSVILSDNLSENTNHSKVETAVVTVKSCEMRELLNEKPKRVENLDLKDFPYAVY